MYPGESARRLNYEFNAKLKKRLRDNKQAIQYLINRGLTIDTIDHFGLGLSTPYQSKKSGREQADALVYPLRGWDEKFHNKYGYYNIPNVTLNPLESNGWISGSDRTYYSDSAAGKTLVFVCQSVMDLWRHWQALSITGFRTDLLLISSTREASFPEEWKEPSFWAGWETIFLGYDNDAAGEKLAHQVAELIGRDARRVRVPTHFGKDWTSFWQGGAELSEFTSLLRDAPIFSIHIQSYSEEAQGYGRFAYKPVNIGGAFHNGYLYYTVQILNRAPEVISKEHGGNVVRDVERLETVVIRSDRTIHSAVSTAAPKGTREKERVMRLTDGTLIDREPQPNKYGTWSWPSIKAYLDGKSKIRKLDEILRDVLIHLKASVWLPHEEDYSILTLIVPITFAQAVFDSVPLILVNGPAGSGKSELGRAMARICSNAYVCGQSSAASIARFIDESRGFVVLDDMEGIGSRGGQFSDLVQALKLSYNKATAVKLWTDVKSMRTQLLDFYGVKMINNTRGTGEILSSRMLRIQTRRIPEHLKDGFGNLLPTENTRLNHLRDELHTWTFENVKLIESTYRELYPKTPDRADEIIAPLYVMAAVAGDSELRSQLEVALTRQKGRSLSLDRPQELLHEALKGLVVQGYDIISPTHLSLEIRRLIGSNGDALSDDIPEWVRPVWVGRMLRSLNVIEEEAAGPKRMRVFGLNLRFYSIRDSYLDQVKEWFAKRNTVISTGTRQPTEFCGDCESCPYSNQDCEIMWKRQSMKKPPRRLL
ncbi:MAG: hypothetical protein WCF57_02015 [Pyrinomonadaceae bacterium]